MNTFPASFDIKKKKKFLSTLSAEKIAKEKKGKTILKKAHRQ